MPPTSTHFSIRPIPSAGRGVLASTPLAPNTPLLLSPPPAAHVIFRQYRREVCAHCLHYDRGRTLPVRDAPIGKVFCAEPCRAAWREAQGPLGVEAWTALETFVRSRAKSVVSTLAQAAVGAKPGAQAVVATWEAAAEVGALHARARGGGVGAADSGPGIKADREYRRALHHVWTQSVDPDILGYLLSGVLTAHGDAGYWQREVEGLAMDEEAYKDTADLEAHCNAFLQLVATVPRELVGSCTVEVCQTLANASSHNSFGIRAGGDEGEEYMGYALYPEASYFNHSCSPSVRKKRVGRQWEFSTAREVGEGEELCITYLGGDEKDLTVTQRRERLRGVWGFECMCERCRREDTS
ncbi:hypothetical protein WHR41_06787 [Cladosporium halotolerans]|uniref:SET domain-containing protein n=1 Tax=Cladosporium halotolerans TaxID=1052096 RepID=A0AB34KJH3_9PEZI